MEIIQIIILLYLSLLLVEILNKLGHVPQRVQMIRWFPLPEARALGSDFRWGGLLMYVVLFVGVWYFNPNNIIIQTIGLVAWVLFIAHTILGSINFEMEIPKKFIGRITTEEIPNNLWYIFIPLGIIAFIFFCYYYLTVAELLFSVNLNIPRVLI